MAANEYQAFSQRDPMELGVAITAQEERGWELVTIVERSDGTTLAFMRRPKS